LGFDPGPVDGVIGGKTRRAIRGFQRSVGVAVDGIPDHHLENQIDVALEESRVARSRNTASTPKPATPQPEAQAVPPRTVVADPPVPVPGSEGLSPADIYAKVSPSVWTVLAGASLEDFREFKDLNQGSAVAISPSHLLTNCHVVSTHDYIAVFQGDTVLAARVTHAEREADRCVVALNEGRLSHSANRRRDFEALRVGERVYTVGSPKGLAQTLGEGIISGLHAEGGVRLIQTTAPISQGSSGGGLFDRFGNLIGITTFLLREGQSLNFAISADDYRP
jgi:S1-C subfamily serine protease